MISPRWYRETLLHLHFCSKQSLYDRKDSSHFTEHILGWGRRVACGDAASVPPIYRRGCRRRIREIAAMICLGRMQNWHQVRPPSVAALRANKNEHNNKHILGAKIHSPQMLAQPKQTLAQNAHPTAILHQSDLKTSSTAPNKKSIWQKKLPVLHWAYPQCWLIWRELTLSRAQVEVGDGLVAECWNISLILVKDLSTWSDTITPFINYSGIPEI